MNDAHRKYKTAISSLLQALSESHARCRKLEDMLIMRNMHLDESSYLHVKDKKAKKLLNFCKFEDSEDDDIEEVVSMLNYSE